MKIRYNSNGEIMKKIGLISMLCFFIDQVVKILVSNTLELNKSIEIVKNFLSITYVQNDGAAWSLFSGNRFFLIAITLVTITLIYFFLIKDRNLKKLDIIVYGLLLGGIIGNLIDRVIFGYVIDYLDFYLFNYNYPVFNLADTFIVISVFFIIVDMFRSEKNANKSWRKKCTFRYLFK